MSEEDH